jgi:hypothetical protein
MGAWGSLGGNFQSMLWFHFLSIVVKFSFLCLHFWNLHYVIVFLFYLQIIDFVNLHFVKTHFFFN